MLVGYQHALVCVRGPAFENVGYDTVENIASSFENHISEDDTLRLVVEEICRFISFDKIFVKKSLFLKEIVNLHFVNVKLFFGHME